MGEGTGLMAFWAKIEPSYLERFRSWHNAEHMPERVSIPGFRAGQRYLGNGSRDFFLMMYETRDPAVLGSEAYLARLNAPTAWTRESLPNFREPARNIYRLLEARGAVDLFRFPCMVSVRFNAASQPEGLVGRISGLAGAGRTRFFGIDSEISGIQTSERKIYGGGPGAQRWLLLVECSLEAVVDGSMLRAAIATEAGAWQDVFVDAFTVDYVLARAAD
ncbi:MAG TPA: hypothetical protein VIS77_02920 [Burkholderiales bacterium]